MHSLQVCRCHQGAGPPDMLRVDPPFSETQVGWRNWLAGVSRIFFTFNEKKCKALFLGKKNHRSHAGWGG